MPNSRRTKKTILLEEFRKKILSGELKPGDLFPSAVMLAPSCNISPRTATSIIRELGRSGLLQVSPGRRSVVCNPGNNPVRRQFEKPIGICIPRFKLISVAKWRDWLSCHIWEHLEKEGLKVQWLPEDFREEELRDYSGFVFAGEMVDSQKWEMAQNTGLACVRLSFLRPYANTVYIDYRSALDRVALFLAGRKCRSVVMLNCSEQEAKGAYNWFSEIGLVRTLQDYNVEEYGFHRIMIPPDGVEERTRLQATTSAIKGKIAFLVGSPAYTPMITECMGSHKKFLGADYELVCLSRAPEESVVGAHIDLKCHEVADRMLELLFSQKIPNVSQIGKVVAAEFIP